MAEQHQENFEKVLREIEDLALKEEYQNKAARLENKLIASQAKRSAEASEYYKDPMIDKQTRWERARHLAERHWSEPQMGYETWLATMGQILALSNMVRDAIHYSTLNPDNYNPQTLLGKLLHSIVFFWPNLKTSLSNFFSGEEEKGYQEEMRTFLDIAHNYNKLDDDDRRKFLNEVKIDWHSLADAVTITDDSKLEVKDLMLPSGKSFPEGINEKLKLAVIEWFKDKGYHYNADDVVCDANGGKLTKQHFEEQLREEFKRSLIEHKTPLAHDFGSPQP